MKLTTSTQVSVDGVMQGPGATLSEDERAVFRRGGWAHFGQRSRDGDGRDLPARRLEILPLRYGISWPFGVRWLFLWAIA